MDSTLDIARRSLSDFLQRTKFPERFPNRLPPPSVERSARETVRSWQLDIPEHIYRKHLDVGINIGFAAYQDTQEEVQVAIALFTFCATMIDEAVTKDTSAIREFVPRFCAGQPQLHPILTRFVETVGALRKFLPEYTANMVYPAMMAFVNEELFCREAAGNLTWRSNSENFMEYSRLKSGMPEPYTACIWLCSAFPDASDYIQAFP